jgi:hypothetical protein
LSGSGSKELNPGGCELHGDGHTSIACQKWYAVSEHYCSMNQRSHIARCAHPVHPSLNANILIVAIGWQFKTLT